MKTLLIRKPSVSKTNQPSWQQAIQSPFTWDSRRLSHGLPWWGCTTFVFACIDSLFSCQMLLSNGPNYRSFGTRACSRSSEFVNSCVRISNLWVSSVQTCRRAQVIRDFVSFAILSFVRDDLLSSSVQTCRRAQVVRDFVGLTILVLVSM